MTENKRFKVVVYDDKAINGFAVLDLQKPNSSKRLKYEDVYIGSKVGCDIVCKFGNSLAEENEDNKRLIKFAYSDNDRLRNKNERLHKDFDKLWELCKEHFTDEEIIKELER